jgi:acyl phosphate:glycerol-3-phosphate acyltransferase
MMQSFEQWIVLIVGYLIAAIPFGVLVSRLVTGSDVRKQGSGNIGATNVARLMGKKWGVLVLFLDALKGYMVVAIAAHFGNIDFANLVAVVAVIGHCYPVYLKFKGGKGVATALGVLTALSPAVVGIAALIFIVVVGVSRRISAGSLTAALSVPVLAIFMASNVLPASGLVIAAIVWWKHRENIKRLARGLEPRFF